MGRWGFPSRVADKRAIYDRSADLRFIRRDLQSANTNHGECQAQIANPRKRSRSPLPHWASVNRITVAVLEVFWTLTPGSLVSTAWVCVFLLLLKIAHSAITVSTEEARY